MKQSSAFAALSMVFVTNAFAGVTNVAGFTSEIASKAVNRTIASQAVKNKSDLIVAVTEPGKVAADTAWLLSNQVKANPQDAPVLLVLKPRADVSMLKSLKLSASDLPALLYLDSKGNVVGRVVDAAPSVVAYK